MSDQYSPLPKRLPRPNFLEDAGLRRVLSAIAVEGDAVRVVGGAVRNSLLGQPISDIDIATTASPATVMARAAVVGLKAVPTGIDHGTVTVIAAHTGYEVTTLRSDVETDGRRAVVAFTRDWRADAERRDFTINAIYADQEGVLFDPVGGITDLLARRVRFIGDPEQRIGEDYLRILRFFRFHARYGQGAPDAEGLGACIKRKAGLAFLARERIGQEIRKLLVAPRAPETLEVMESAGLLNAIFPQSADLASFAHLRALVPRLKAVEDPMLALAALAVRTIRDAADLSGRLRLSRAEARQLKSLAEWSEKLGEDPGEQSVRLAVYSAGNAIASGAIALAAARTGAGLPVTIDIALDWTAPRFPRSGKDLIAEGLLPGPEIGRRLAEEEAAWIAAGFKQP